MPKNKILSALVIKNEVSIGRLVDLGFNWMYLEQYRTLSEDIEAIKSVTIENVNNLAQEVKPTEFTKVSIGPDK